GGFGRSLPPPSPIELDGSPPWPRMSSSPGAPPVSPSSPSPEGHDFVSAHVSKPPQDVGSTLTSAVRGSNVHPKPKANLLSLYIHSSFGITGAHCNPRLPLLTTSKGPQTCPLSTISVGQKSDTCP